MRVRYGKPIKVKSMLSNSSARDISNSGSYALVYKNWGTGADVEFRAFTEADYSHKFFCYTEFELATNNFTYTGFAAQGTSESTYKPNNYSLCSINKPTANAVSLYVYGALQSPITVKTRFMIDLTEIGLDNLTAQQFYNKYNKYFPLIATGEEITIDKKIGSIADDLYYGYNQKTSLAQYNYGGLEITPTDLNKVTIVGTANNTWVNTYYRSPIDEFDIPAGHKVFMTGFDGNNKIILRFMGQNYAGAFNDVSSEDKIYSPTYGVFRFSMIIAENTQFNDEEYVMPQVIDLTDWYGAGNEPATVEEFKEKFPNDYYVFCRDNLKLTRHQINALPIYGYNQLCENGNFANGFDNWLSISSGSGVVSNNVATITTSGNYSGIGSDRIDIKKNHKYFVSGDMASPTVSNKCQLVLSDNTYFSHVIKSGEISNTLTTYDNIFEITTDVGTNPRVFVRSGTFSGSETIYATNIKVIDLTDWYGAGNEPVTVDEFKQTFPNNYYPYSKKRLLNKYMINYTEASVLGNVAKFKVAGGQSDTYYNYNQQITHNTFDELGTWRIYMSSRSNLVISNNKATVTSAESGGWPYEYGLAQSLAKPIEINHKYFVSAKVTTSYDTRVKFEINSNEGIFDDFVANTPKLIEGIVTTPIWYENAMLIFPTGGFDPGKWFSVENVNIFDLTDWYGAGKEPTTVAEIRNKFTKDYYDFSINKTKMTRYQIESTMGHDE